MTRSLLPLRVEAAAINEEVVSQGVMLCIKPPAALAERIAVPSGDAPDQLHVTVVYFGSMNEVDMASIERLKLKLPWLAANLPQIGVGFNRVERLGPNQATVLAGENGSLVRWRDYLCTILREYVDWVDTYAYYPHMTLGYWNTDAEAPELGPYSEAVAWVADSLYLSAGSALNNYPLDNNTSETADQWTFEYEELVNHNHTPTSAHPNAAGSTKAQSMAPGAKATYTVDGMKDGRHFEDHGLTHAQITAAKANAGRLGITDLRVTEEREVSETDLAPFGHSTKAQSMAVPAKAKWEKVTAGHYRLGNAEVEQIHSRAFGKSWRMRVDGKRIHVPDVEGTKVGAIEAVEGYLHGQAGTPDHARMGPANAPLFKQTAYHRGFMKATSDAKEASDRKIAADLEAQAHGSSTAQSQSAPEARPFIEHPFWTPRPAPAKKAPARTKVKYRFEAARTDYYPGDEREYHVSHQGRTIGVVSPTWEPSRTPNGEPVSAWSFTSSDGKMWGIGRTRGDAVTNALKKAESEVSPDATTASASPTLSIRVR